MDITLSYRFHFEIACDHHEAEQFAEWLRNVKGHDVKIGNTTWNYVNGKPTHLNEGYQTILTELWEEYCKSK